MARPVVLDVSRAISRAHHSAPTGIDRVDAAYRRWAIGMRDRPVFAVARFRRAVWLIGREGLAALDDVLAGRAPPPALDLAGIAALRRPAPARRAEALIARAALDRVKPGEIGRMVARHAPGASYLNTSHSGALARDLEGLAKAGVKPVAMIHDTLPLDRPEFFTPETPPHFEAKLRSALSHCSALITNSEATSVRVRHWAGVWGVPVPEIQAAPLGVETPKAERAEPDQRPATFVALGTIEPRKNLPLLLNVWAQLFQKVGPNACPHLHVVGRRGWRNEAILKQLTCGPAAGVVVHKRGALVEADLQALIARATALLTPSHDEGFGLPVAEALAMGVPVIASDIPAHREVGGEGPDYLDPLDEAGWRAAILAYATPASEQAAAARRRAERYVAPNWDAHFDLIEAFLDRRQASPRA